MYVSLASASKVRLISARRRGTGKTAYERPASLAAFATRMASDVLPVPTGPSNQRPRPASRLSSIERVNARTWRSTARSSETIGSRSNDTSRKRRPIPVPMPPLAALRTRWSRQRQGRDSLVSSSRIQVEPSHSPKGQAACSSAGTSRSTSEHPVPGGDRLPGTLAVEVREARILGQEGEADLPDRPVAVLGQDDARLPEPLRLLVVVLLAVDEHDDVGVLLDLPAFTKVGEHRDRRVARLDGARQLRHRDHGDLELAGEDLEPAAHLADGLDAAVGAAVGAEQLEVVHDDQPEPVPGMESARLGAHLEDADVAGVVDEDRRLGQLLDGAKHLGPAVGLDTALAELVARDLRLGGDEAMGELGLGHLEREQGGGPAVVDGGILHNVGGQRRFAHRWPCRQHDQVARLESARQLVDVGEARGGAGQADALSRELLELVDLLVEDVLDRPHLGEAALVADLEELRLGSLDQVARLAAVGEHLGLDPAGRVEDAAHQRVVADDSGVVEDRSHSGDDRWQRVDVGVASGRLQLAVAAQVVADGQRVDRLGLGLLLQADHRPEDELVARAVEVVGPQPDLEQHAVKRLLGEQDRAEDGGLRLLVVRRDAAR